MCDCEVRTSDSSETGFKRMKDIAEEWLEKYGDNYEGCYKDYFHISNPHGAWGDTSKKAFWLKDTI